MNAVGDEPANVFPKPVNDIYPRAAEPSRALPPGRAITMGDSGKVELNGIPPEWQQNQWQGIGAPKRLPPASMIFAPPAGSGQLPGASPGTFSPHTTASPLISPSSPMRGVNDLAIPLDRSGGRTVTMLGKDGNPIYTVDAETGQIMPPKGTK